MLNTYPLWKYLLIFGVLVLGGIYASPNLYPPDFAVQVSSRATVPPDPVVLRNRVERVLDAAGIAAKAIENEGDRLLVRLRNNDLQLAAREAIARGLASDSAEDSGYTVALNLAPTTPDWLTALGAQPMKYGLDLSGGVHFLLEVDIPQALADRLKIAQADMARVMREAGIRYSRPRIVDNAWVEVAFADAARRDAAQSAIAAELTELELRAAQVGSQPGLRATYSERAIDEIEAYAINQNLQSLRNRVNELGVSEPLVQRLGSNRIVLDLPGIQDSARAKEIIGKTANLEFRLVADRDSLGGTEDHEYEGRVIPLERTPIVTGDRVANAQVGMDPDTQQPQVSITLDSRGGELMNRATRNAVGRSMAILFKEKQRQTRYEVIDGVEQEVPVVVDRERLISVATIQAVLDFRFRITGLQQREASDLALLLRAGALAAPVYVVEERTVGASLGEENIERGIESILVGFGLVVLFMVAYYRLLGVAAVLALAANLVLLVAVMSTISATLTMPGLAGIVLTVGMAVDANVLIFSRIREELLTLSPQKAIHSGFERAFETILDANVTTFIVAIILYVVGSGPIKGFAVTLSIGILTSMFTAILCTRALVNLLYGGRRLETLTV